MNQPTTLEQIESCLLGGIIFQNEALADALRYISGPAEFSTREHQRIFASMLRLSEQGHPIDAMTIVHDLSSRKDEQDERAIEVGDLLAMMELSPTAANICLHSRLVHENYLRKLITAEVHAIGKLLSTAPIEELASRFELTASKLADSGPSAGLETAAGYVVGAMEEVLARRNSPPSSILSGFADLDMITDGFQPGDLVVLAGRPSMGKTALALNIAEHAALECNHPTAFFSAEMAGKKIALRSLSSLTQIPTQELRSGMGPESPKWEDLSVWATRLHDAPLWIDETSTLTVEAIRTRCRKLAKTKGLSLVIIDYLQLLMASPTDKRLTRDQEIGHMTRSLKALAKELAVPVVLLSQLRRGAEERVRPALADLRESGSIEQDADLVAFIHRQEYYNPDPSNKGMAELIIGKHRNGGVGTVRLSFNAELTKFTSVSEEVLETGTNEESSHGYSDEDLGV